MRLDKNTDSRAKDAESKWSARPATSRVSFVNDVRVQEAQRRMIINSIFAVWEINDRVM